MPRHSLLKAIVDVGVGRKVEAVLKSRFFDVKSMLDEDPKAKDINILELAINEDRIVITMDKDFCELVFNSGLKHVGVLLLRLDFANGEEKALIVQAILESHAHDLKTSLI